MHLKCPPLAHVLDVVIQERGRSQKAKSWWEESNFGRMTCKSLASCLVGVAGVKAGVRWSQTKETRVLSEGHCTQGWSRQGEAWKREWPAAARKSVLVSAPLFLEGSSSFSKGSMLASFEI